MGVICIWIFYKREFSCSLAVRFLENESFKIISSQRFYTNRLDPGILQIAPTHLFGYAICDSS